LMNLTERSQYSFGISGFETTLLKTLTTYYQYNRRLTII
jgi:hypothetical protein